MSDTPRTNDIIEQIVGFRTSSAIYSLEQFSRLLERELTAVTEQRDRLLEQQEQWRLSSVCRELVEQRDVAIKCHEWCYEDRKRIIEELTSVTEQRDAVALRLGNTQERMFNAERQRDRLAEELRKVLKAWDDATWLEGSDFESFRETLQSLTPNEL
jgi:hypothetical protein